MHNELKTLIDETLNDFFKSLGEESSGIIKEEYRDICPHCKQEIQEMHDYTEDGGLSWKHSDCKGVIYCENYDDDDDELTPLNDYIGNVVYPDVVHGEAVWDFRSKPHNSTDKNWGNRWKYSREYNCVIWSNDVVDRPSSILVDKWLEKRGVKSPKHMTYVDFYREFHKLHERLPIGGDAKYIEQNKQQPGSMFGAANSSTIGNV